jgi:hypothetical protein
MLAGLFGFGVVVVVVPLASLPALLTLMPKLAIIAH